MKDFSRSLLTLLPQASRALAALPSDRQVNVSGLALDSRQVEPGDLFLARDGLHHRGADFIAQAVARGAVAVMAQRGSVDAAEKAVLEVPLIEVDDLDATTGQLASRFYGDPSRHLKVIGITGTNGKTSCSHYLAQALEAMGHRCALIGTLGNGIHGALQESSHTTPNPIELQSLLADFVRQGAEYVVMEVSSHALDQQRVAGVRFAAAALTNLTRDHLDYHGDMETYGQAKARLFTDYAPPLQALNLDDAFGRRLYADRCGDRAQVLGFSLTDPAADLWVSDLEPTRRGWRFVLHAPAGQQPVTTALLGRFNVSNLLLTASLLQLLGFSLEQTATALSALQPVSGRMECLPSAANLPQVVIDYAHTPDALEQALQALRLHQPDTGQLWCVFGCGGDRDRGKRPEMGRVAARGADQLVLTSDNPRREEPGRIMTDILQGIPQGTALHQEENRAEAIRWAITRAAADDLILIAGKGHENYQEVGSVRTPFSDHEQAQHVLKQRVDV